MKRTSSKVIVILLALTFVATASAAFAQGICPSAKITGSIESMISRGYCLFVAGKFKEAQEEFEKVLAKDPGNPVALNDLAAVMVKENKLDKADTYLAEALPKAKGYHIYVNRVCAVQDICLAIEPYKCGAGCEGANQDLGELIQYNSTIVKAKMAAEKAGAGAGYPGVQ